MKKVVSIVLTLLLVLCSFAGCGDNNDATTTTQAPATEPPRQIAKTEFHTASEAFAGGNGTESDPFQINEAGHFVLLHEMLKKEYEDVNLGKTYTEGFYILTADIVLNDTSDFANWATNAPTYGWTPIGTDGHNFAGVLDGNGHKITGMFIDANGSETANPNDSFGLFSELHGTVKNLTIEQSYLRTEGDTTTTGTIAGYAYNGTIENCTADTVIEIYDNTDVGGITGSYGTITDCTFSGTITQLDDGIANIGGIAGATHTIENCVFSGTLTGNAHTGGIVGYGGNVKNCTNKGTVIGENAGGISGRVYEAGTNQEIKTTQITIENCINEGNVTGTAVAGGIVGGMGNDESDISMSVINCENKGTVAGNKKVAGIIGQLEVARSGLIKIENCINHSDITAEGNTGGIICDMTGSILHQEGDVVISGCKNLGNITAEGTDTLYSAGILTNLLVMAETIDFNLTIENCGNEGNIQSETCAGGIVAFSNIGFNASASADSMAISKETFIALNNCKNNGDVTVQTSNCFAGGVVGVLGLGTIKTNITNCENNGNIKVDFSLTDAQIAEQQGAQWPEFFQIAGGIIGRIGDGLKLSTIETDKQHERYVNAEDADIMISGCINNGTVTAPDYSFILNQWEQPLYVNYLGGVVGQAAATIDYKFSIENCTYTGADRGFGDTAYEDFGTKN